MANVDSMVRVGVVSDVKGSKARVFYPDMGNMVSDWLYVLQHPNAIASSKSNVESSISGWHPNVNDTVLVLYAFGFNSDGFILGVV